MDCRHYITDLPERKSGQHLQREERGAIQALKRQGLSNRAIARALGCSPTTIGNELRRGTPSRKSSKGRAPGYCLIHSLTGCMRWIANPPDPVKAPATPCLRHP